MNLKTIELESGPLYEFRDWPNPAVPKVAAGVYTIWRGPEFIYVGMSGRSLGAADVIAHRQAAAKGKGLFCRLASHASGRRSGDQFCVYVCDRMVLPTLDAQTISGIAYGTLSLDALVRTYIHAHLSYRFVEVEDGATALTVEAVIRRGMLRAGKPLLNPAL